MASHPSRDEDSGVGQDDRTWTPQEGASSVLDLGARLLEAHGVAAVGCHGGGVFWGNRVALDLVRPVDDDPSEEELTAILATALRLPGDLDLAEGEEREIEIELSANRALLSLRAHAVGGSDDMGRTTLVTFRAPLEAAADPAHVHRLETMLDATSDIVTVIDGEGRIRFSNPAAGRLTGMSGAEANGASLLDFVHPEDADVVADAFRRGVLQGLEIEPVDLRIRMSDGRWHHTEARLSGVVDVDGVSGHVVTVRDVTDRVRRETENVAHRRRLESIVQNIDDVIVILGPDLSVTWTTPNIEQLIDAPAYTNVGENAFNDMHEDDVEAVLTAIGEATARPNGRAHVTFRLQHIRHGWRWVDAVIVNRSDDPAIEGLVCTLRDVTDERDPDAAHVVLSDRERDLTAELRESEAMKDRFLATISHELRTPLTSVRGFSNVLEEQWQRLDDVTRAQLVGRVAANAETMERLIEQLLDFARLQASVVELELAPVALAEVLHDLIDELEVPLEGHVVDVQVGDHRVLGDRRAIETVMRNLLTNAARYSAVGSTISVRADRDQVDLHIRVVDQGIGIAVEDQTRVFQSFFQSAPGHPDRRGSGIGLNIARRYAQLQSGHLTLESEPGVGSTFTFTLRAAD